jgi:hypothetical protein
VERAVNTLLEMVMQRIDIRCQVTHYYCKHFYTDKKLVFYNEAYPEDFKARKQTFIYFLLSQGSVLSCEQTLLLMQRFFEVSHYSIYDRLYSVK